MIQLDTAKLETVKSERRRGRGLMVLTLVSLMTVGVIAGSTEFIAQRQFRSLRTVGEDCIFNDPLTGARGKPNSICLEKIPEGELTEYRFNSCGYRAGMECGPKPSGTYRIVMVGTSFTMGMRVPRDKTFAALLPQDLSRRTGRNVELYNEAMPYRYPDGIAHDFNEVLAAGPDLVLWVLNPGDFQEQSWVGFSGIKDINAKVRGLSLPARAWQRLLDAFSSKSMPAAASDLFSHTRTATMLSHFLYQSPSLYVTFSVMDDAKGKTNYLKSGTNTVWAERMKNFDKDVASIQMQAAHANVPLVVVLLPNHAQAAMISMKDWPDGYDPYKLNRDLNTIVTAHGGIYVDVMQDLRAVADPQEAFFPVEGHPNPRGHAMFSQLIAKELTAANVPGLSESSQSRAGLETGR